MASKKYDISLLKDLSENWQEPLTEALSDKDKEDYFYKKAAVDMYIGGYKAKVIEEMTGVSPSHCSKLISRCLTKAADGNYLGYLGLIKNLSLATTMGSRPQEFSELLEKYPSLVDFLEGNYSGNKKYTLEKNMNLKTLHKKLLSECLRLGVQMHEYPFNTENKGYASLCSYMRSVEKKKTSLQASRLEEDSRKKYDSTGKGKRYSANAAYPFSVVQVDGHIIDLMYTVEIWADDGTVIKAVATRAWLIAIIDVATRCILGYSISQEFNYNQYDVMDAVKDAITPKKPLNLSIKGLEYPSNGGYYSTAFPNLKNVLFDTIMLDNAKSHLSKYSQDKLVDRLGCCVNYGSVATPETRGIIERFFGTLETRGFHRMAATTGSSIQDLKRRNPEAAAIKYNITFEQIRELLDVLIAEYNNEPHSSIFGLSPLQAMEKKIYEAGMWPTIADERYIEEIEKLSLRTDRRKVVGKAKNGKHPHINFMGAEYSSPILSANESYLNEELIIEYNPRDISTVEAYSTDGVYIDTLVARGEFGTKSHSIQTRRKANKLAREKTLDKCTFPTPISAYEQHLYEEGKKSRRKATKADIVRREMGKATPSEMPVVTGTDNIIPITSKDKLANNEINNINDISLEELYSVLFGRKE